MASVRHGGDPRRAALDAGRALRRHRRVRHCRRLLPGYKRLGRIMAAPISGRRRQAGETHERTHWRATHRTTSHRPTEGLRVFDLTRVLAGPTCAQMLADLGADVIKIERPGAGDDTRGFAPPYMPGTKESAYFVGVNRNKRSVTLDIAQPGGPGDRAAADRAVRHPGGELQGRRAGEIRAGLRAAAREVSAADLLLDHRVRPDRAVCAAAGL